MEELRSWKCLYVGLLFLSCRYLNVMAQFPAEPINDFAKVGESVKLICKIEKAGKIGNPQSWWEHNSSEKRSWISQNDIIQVPNTGKYIIEEQYNLKIPNVTLDHGGKYSCSDGYGNESFVQLIVLESDTLLSGFPIQNPIVEGFRVRYSCLITYKGYWAPQIEWIGSKSGVIPHSDESTRSTVKTYIDIETTQLNHEEFFACSTSFGKHLIPSPGENDASNIPSYSLRLESQPLEIYYAPHNVSIINQEGSLITNISFVDELTLSCVSSSNPPAFAIQWMHVEKRTILHDGQLLHLTDNSAMGLNTFTLRCTVENMLNSTYSIIGQSSAEITVESTGGNGEQDDAVPIVPIVVGALCLLSVVGNVVLVCKRRSKEPRKERKPLTEKHTDKPSSTSKILKTNEELQLPSIYLETTVKPGTEDPSQSRTQSRRVNQHDKITSMQTFNTSKDNRRPLPDVPPGTYEELNSIDIDDYLQPYMIPVQRCDVTNSIGEVETGLFDVTDTTVGATTQQSNTNGEEVPERCDVTTTTVEAETHISNTNEDEVTERCDITDAVGEVETPVGNNI